MTQSRCDHLLSEWLKKSPKTQKYFRTDHFLHPPLVRTKGFESFGSSKARSSAGKKVMESRYVDFLGPDFTYYQPLGKQSVCRKGNSDSAYLGFFPECLSHSFDQSHRTDICVTGRTSVGDSLLLTEGCVHKAGRADPTQRRRSLLCPRVGCWVQFFSKAAFWSLAYDPGVSTRARVFPFEMGFSEF